MTFQWPGGSGSCVLPLETGAKKIGPLVSFTLPIFDPGWVAYELTLAQLPDGGWGQNIFLPSDAYATG